MIRAIHAFTWQKPFETVFHMLNITDSKTRNKFKLTVHSRYDSSAKYNARQTR
jgi:hypothetical protein